MGLSFLHPLIALGALGIAAPIIIHFFFRRRAKTLDFPPMRFVLLSYKKVARKLMVQEYILLATRCLIALLLALAIAVPVYSKLVSGIKRGERPVAAVFVIDTSLSMTRSDGGDSLLDSAKKKAAQWASGLTENDRAGVIDGVRLSGSGLVSDTGPIEEEIAAMGPTYGKARLMESISLASSWMEGLSEMDRMVVVFTDLQRASWGGSRPSGEMPAVYVVDVADEIAPRNISVSGVRIEWKSLAREEAAEVSAGIKNHGEEDAGRILVRVGSEGSVLTQGFVELPSGEGVRKSFVLTEAPGGPATVAVEADDGMPGDNSAWFHLRGGGDVSALVVDGDPGASYLASETYFLDRALDPKLYARSRVRPASATPDELDDILLSDYQVLVLANVGRISPKVAEKIKTFVSEGGGLFLSLGTNVDADTYNTVFGGLLPRELRGVKVSYAGAAGSSDIREMHLESPTVSADPHPILSIFGGPGQGDLGLAGFWKYFLMQQEAASETRVVLRLTDGVPIMVEGDYGKGRVVVLASSVDRAWSDLCIHPVFLPLMQQTIQYLAGALLSKDEGGLVVGRILELPVASSVTGAKVLCPDGKTREAEVVQEEGDRRVRIGWTELPGVYYVRFIEKGDDADSSMGPEDADRTLVLNVDPEESDLDKAGPSDLSAIIGSKEVTVISGDRGPSDEQASTVERKSYAGPLLLLLVALAILERALTRKG